MNRSAVVTTITVSPFSMASLPEGMIDVYKRQILNKTISGKSYLYPLIPFNGKELKKKLIRTRLHVKY